MGKSKKSKKKLEIIFDDKSRRDFLTGFRKRKNERKKRAKEEFERILKSEKERIRRDIKTGLKNHLQRSYQQIPEVENILKEEDIEDDHVTVKVTELSLNHMVDEIKSGMDENHQKCDSDCDVEDDEPKHQDQKDIPGMDLVQLKKKNVKKELKSNKEFNEVKSKKDVNRLLQKKISRKMKNNKIIRKKENNDRLLNKKKAKQNRNKLIRQLKKGGSKNPKKYLAMKEANNKGNKRNRK